MSFVASKNAQCHFCGKTVYAMERMDADGKSMHKACFKCEHCQCVLKLGNFAAMGGRYFCKVQIRTRTFYLRTNSHIAVTNLSTMYFLFLRTAPLQAALQGEGYAPPQSLLGVESLVTDQIFYYIFNFIIFN
jgi:hypothetical protein